MTRPLVFAFDTSGPHCAAALLEGDDLRAAASVPMARGQAENLMSICDEVLRSGGAAWSDLDLLAVGTGPGNFTGLRISVSAARGLALGLDIPALGISALQAQAFGLGGSVVSTLDARRDMLYFQSFNCETEHAPEMVSIDALPVIANSGELSCVGHRAEEVAAGLSGTAVTALYPLAEAIARIALSLGDRQHPRPAPLYIRPADAAPARDAPPAILP